MRNWILGAVGALVCGFAGAALWQYSGLGERATRAYLVANPDILQEMAEAFQRKQMAERLAGVKVDVATPFPGAVLGNPQGKRTLVEFTDFACTYCKASLPDVDRLLAADPELRVVIREWPIFQGSEEAARMGLAAASQGKYPAFYKAMFERAPPTPKAIEEAARIANLDMDMARRFAASEAVTQELARNQAMAQQLAFTGTPSWVAGGTILEGAVGHLALAKALKDEGEE